MGINERYRTAAERTFMEDECLIWAGELNSRGYGRISFHYDGKYHRVAAHRVLYENHIGKIPEGLVLDHLCRNRQCINPDHLEAVTSKENIYRGEGGAAKNRFKTHCTRGHLYEGDNLVLREYKRGNGVYRVRRCRECVKTYNARYIAKTKSHVL